MVKCKNDDDFRLNDQRCLVKFIIETSSAEYITAIDDSPHGRRGRLELNCMVWKLVQIRVSSRQ